MRTFTVFAGPELAVSLLGKIAVPAQSNKHRQLMIGYLSTRSESTGLGRDPEITCPDSSAFQLLVNNQGGLGLESHFLLAVCRPCRKAESAMQMRQLALTIPKPVIVLLAG